MDVTNLLKFPDEEFTVIFDKGCIDSLFCSLDYTESINKTINELYRVLKKNGGFISISHATAPARVPYYRQVQWAIECFKINSDIGEGLNLYILNKTDDPTLLNKKILGGEVAVRSKSSRIFSKLKENMNKSSTVKSGKNSGSLTVTASVEVLSKMIEDGELENKI
jgi:SAM-dependent methyltransferase